jgi:hypothetical protein
MTTEKGDSRARLSFSLPKEKAAQIAHAMLAASAGIDQSMECSSKSPSPKPQPLKLSQSRVGDYAAHLIHVCLGFSSAKCIAEAIISEAEVVHVCRNVLAVLCLRDASHLEENARVLLR